MLVAVLSPLSAKQICWNLSFAMALGALQACGTSGEPDAGAPALAANATSASSTPTTAMPLDIGVAAAANESKPKLTPAPTPAPAPAPAPAPTPTSTNQGTGTPAIPVVQTSSVPNTLAIKNPGTAIVQNYPLQFGRPFGIGEIPASMCPVIAMNGSALLSQTDVKNRWPDGSLRFAVLSTVLDPIGVSASAQISISPGTCAPEAPLSKDQMLAVATDFDVVVELNGGAAGRVSARDILNAGAVTTWTRGPITTTAVIADHTAKAFDFGTDAFKSLRPIVHAQFWPSINAYKVRVIVEQSDTTKLQNQTYAVKVTSGLATPVVAYENTQVAHNYGSRWTREFWVGSGKPAQQLSIQHNVAYLASTKAIPNYDARITYAASSRSALLSQWASAPKDIYASGLWTKYMPTTGGRMDIGLFPTWLIAALYSGDSELLQLSAKQTDLAAAWPMNFRIGDNRTFDQKTGAAGLGRIATRDAFPTQFLYSGNGYLNSNQVATSDRFTTVASFSDGGWVCDGAHLPDPWYLMYIMTGDPWYLEQLQFWASWGLFTINPGSATWGSGRDPRDTVVQDQLRAVAWLMRTRARAAAASVDGTPEKIYLTRSVEQALRMMEGVHIGASLDPIRSWWAANAPMAANPLRYWQDGDAAGVGVDTTKAATITAPWMHSMMIQSLGHAVELGFNASELLSWFGQSWISLINEPGMDARHLADYRMVVRKASGGYFQTWADTFSATLNWSSDWDATLRDTEHGYAVLATAAVSFLAKEPGGATAWNWINSNGYTLVDWQANPKMAILPR